jgi:hypothetical protein
MKTEKKQKENKSKFNLEKMKVAQLDNLQLINGGNSAIIAEVGDDKTITQSNKMMTVTY